MHHNLRLKKRLEKGSSSGHLIFSPDVRLLVISSRAPNHKVNPPTHVLQKTVRELLELQLKNSFSASKPNAFTRGRKSEKE